MTPARFPGGVGVGYNEAMARLLSIAALCAALVACKGSDAPPPPAAPAPAAAVAPADRPAVAEARLGKIADALDTYLKIHMEYPDLLEVLIRDDLARPADFDDPWGHRVDYTRRASQAYLLCSRGRDNLPKTEDDVCLPGSPGKR